MPSQSVNVQFNYTFHGNKPFQQASKNKSPPQSNTTTLPSNHVLILQPDTSCQQLKRTCYLPCIEAMLSSNLRPKFAGAY